MALGANQVFAGGSRQGGHRSALDGSRGRSDCPRNETGRPARGAKGGAISRAVASGLLAVGLRLPGTVFANQPALLARFAGVGRQLSTDEAWLVEARQLAWRPRACW